MTKGEVCMIKKKKIRLSSTHIIMLSFLAAIIVGTLLLMLPISSASGNFTPLPDALFTSTTSICVTGLVVVPTFSYWSFFGQAVILVLIQIGGLGVITVMAALALFLNKKMGLSGRMLLQDSFNLNTLSGLTSFLKKVVIGTFVIEALGALLYMTVFIPQFGAKGIWISVFNSISAFCNAGLDVIGNNSLCSYATHPLINAVTCLLIILGGLGYIVWWDVIRVIKERKNMGGRLWHRLTLHSKIVLLSTAALIFTGAALFLLFEYNNPLTLGKMTLYNKIQAAFFQSVTTRTAGFATIPQETLTTSSSALSLLLMFIGGSPVGTAGGVKTVTFVILIAAALSAIRGKNETALLNRTVTKPQISRALGVVFMSFTIMFLSTLALSATADASFIDIMFETVSATATVGLSRALTPLLNTASKLIITVTMYLGRVGPISLAFAFNVKNRNQNAIKDPVEEVSIG